MQINQIPFQPICNELQVSVQVLYNPFADRLCVRINQLSTPLSGCKGQNQVESDF